MTNEQLIAKYNPANARNLSQADIDAMHDFTDDQLKTLAEAFPNNANRKPYLLLHDNNITQPGKQLYPLSTWQNLYNVRKFSGKKNLVAHTFKELFTTTSAPKGAARVSRAGSTAGKPTTSARKVVDLSADEAAAELGALKKEAPVKTMIAKTVPENEPAANAGTSVAQPAAKAATTRASRSGKGAAAKKAETAPAVSEPAGDLPADQQMANIDDDVTDTNVGDTENGGDAGKGDNLGL